MAKKCLVTGCAGFIGSHLSERLIQDGHTVVGIDCFSDFYPRSLKERNLANIRAEPRFTFIEANILQIDLATLLNGVQWIFHEAAQAGVRTSWGEDFRIYTENNVLATQRLLEAARHVPDIEKFVYASSSSVYGDAEHYPTHETTPPQPVSPYGVTKLAGEHLCQLYYRNFNVPTLSLRYFTVYGPRQRPDMAFHRFITAILEGRPLVVYGDGTQTRDFTYISDAVEANVLAAARGHIGHTYNIGGGAQVPIAEVISLLRQISGRDIAIIHAAPQKGDVRHTGADTSKAARELGFHAQVTLHKGLEKQFAWHLEVQGRPATP